jgi:hypothetical protein
MLHKYVTVITFIIYITNYKLMKSNIKMIFNTSKNSLRKILLMIIHNFLTLYYYTKLFRI